MAFIKNIPKGIQANNLDFGSDVVKAIKNPLRALYLPISWLWKLGRPLVGMDNKNMTDIPSEIFKLGARTAIGAVSYSTRLALNGIMNLPVIPIPSGEGLQSIRKTTTDIKDDILDFKKPEIT